VSKFSSILMSLTQNWWFFIPCTPGEKGVFENVPIAIVPLGQEEDGVNVSGEENVGDQVELGV
jgi:hypothetical protein